MYREKGEYIKEVSTYIQYIYIHTYIHKYIHTYIHTYIDIAEYNFL